MNKPILALKLIVLAWLCVANVQATIRYVKPSSTSPAWQTQTNVYTDLQVALTAAVYGDEIWVAAGTYKPTTGINRAISFKLKNGVAVYGGFAGAETTLAQRNWVSNPTILSGDIGVEGTNSDNSYSVVNAVGTSTAPLDNTTRLDGVVIENGYSNSDGGGADLSYANLTIANTIFRNNYAADDGGAVYAANSSNSNFANTLFISNKSNDSGGAVYALSTLSFTHCTFANNRSVNFAGAVYSNSNSTITNSIAWGNSAKNSYPQHYNVTCTYSCVEGGYIGTGNISNDPLFIDAPNGDYRLGAASPCIDKGQNSNTPAWLTADFFGNARLSGTTVDMGFIEGGVTTPLLMTPTNKSVFPATITSVALAWEWPAAQPPGITGYEIEVELNGADTQRLSINTTYTYLDDIEQGTSYLWRVRGIDGTAFKNWSPWVSFVVTHATPLYVKTGGTGDGLSWATAMGSIQAAIDAAVYGDEIWVAAGTYIPTNGSDRSVRFKLKDGVAIYGGFAGTETNLAQRNWVSYPTILSGDIGVVGVDTDNSYTVVAAMGTLAAPLDNTTRLDGVIIERGYSSESAGGAYLSYANPTIVNTIFRNNIASRGGAVFAANSNSIFANTLFASNRSSIDGGAVYATYGLTFTHCTFANNLAEGRGGAVFNSSGKSAITNCIAWGNSAKNSDPQFFNATCTYSCVEGGYTGTGNISNAPFFIDAANGDYRLNTTSPCIDKGLNSNTPAWLTSDFFGNARLSGTIVDLGFTEGGIATPLGKTPASKTLFPATTTSVALVWEWLSPQPVGITGYEIELQLNGGNSQLLGTTNLTYSLNSIVHGSSYKWRVRGIDGTTLKNWSPWYTFDVNHATPLYVKTGGTGDGLSWTTAMGSVQAAIDAAFYGDQIWISAGTYKPTTGADRNISFNLKNGVAIYGGFAGTETLLPQRNWMSNPTILSGDIGVAGTDFDNSYTVVKALGTSTAPFDNTTRLDGVIIEKAYSNDFGGGTYLSFASPTIANTLYRNNYALYSGGAVCAINSSSIFANTLFVSNKAMQYGGAVYTGAPLSFIHCTFFNNRSEVYGGAIYNNSSTIQITNSIAWGNSAKYDYDQFYHVTCTYSCIEGDYTGIGNTSSDPMFLDAVNGDYRLNAISPCVDKGLNSATPAWLSTNFDGNARLMATTTDMGIFEGGVPTPINKAPANNAVFPSTTTTVALDWQWATIQPSGITGYEIELQLNGGTPVLVPVLASPLNVSNIIPGSAYKWRVRGVDGTTLKNWSPWTTFVVKHASPLYVKVGGTGNGLSWGTAMGSVQAAIDAAVYSDEIWIAAGTYKPTTGADRAISINLKDGVAIYGGFAGSEMHLEQRNWINNPTILSGDIGIIGTDTDNSYTVIKAIGSNSNPVDNTTRLDGVIIEKGYSNYCGGGANLSYANLTVVNSLFRNNFTSDHGGAVFATNSNSSFANTLFISNKANYDGGAVFTRSQMTFSHCIFANNRSEDWGGAVLSLSNFAKTTIANSIAWGNSAKNLGSQFVAVTCEFSCVEGGYTGDNNISTDPLFVDAANGNYRLNDMSPCINKGLNSGTPAWLTTDFYGNARLIGTTVDMGIAESNVATSNKPALPSNAKSVSVYPNPVKSSQPVVIKLTTSATNAKVRLFDARGNLKVEEAIVGTDQYTFHNTNFASGVYMEIVDADEKSVIKLIIQ